MDELLSVTKFAKEAGDLSPWTVWSWLSKGILQRTKVGRRTMIRRSEMQKVIVEGGKSPAPRWRNR